MNRVAGIIVAAVGLIIAVLSILKIIPGVTGAGVALIIGGGLMIGLSFINGPESNGTERMSTPSTIGNIFLAPTEVFRNLRYHPRFMAALLIITFLSACWANLFINRIGPATIANYTIDKTLEMSMIANNEDAKKRIEDGRAQAILDAAEPMRRTMQVGSTFVGVLVVNSIGAVLFLVLALAMGGRINFFQSLSVFVYASLPIQMIRFILNTILLYLKDPSDIHPILGQQSLIQDNLNFLVKSGEHPVIFSFLTAISVLNIYWIWLLATGFKNAGDKVSPSIAWAGALGIFGIVMMLGLLLAFMFPSFIS